MEKATLEPIPSPTLPAVGHPRSSRIRRVIFLGLLDLVFLLTAWILAYLLWAGPVHGGPASLYVDLTPLACLFILGYARTGLYPGFGLGAVETLRRLTYVNLFGFLVLAAASFVMQTPHIYSRITFALAGILTLVLVPLGRFVLGRIAMRSPWWPEPALIIGTGERARATVTTLRNNPETGYRPWAVLTLSPEAEAEEQIDGVPVVGGLGRAKELTRLGIATALLEPDDALDSTTLDELQSTFPHVVMLGHFADLPVEGVEIRNLGGALGIEYTNSLLKWHNRVFKRAVDIAVASCLLLASLPLIAIAAMAVKSADSGPIFFVQRRVGLHGAELLVPKLRTMKMRAEEELEHHLEAHPDLRAEWERRKKLPQDPRLIPRVGQFLRRWSIDELPQLWLVVRGQMSLVGPRPLPEYHLAEFSGSFRRLRQRARPGLTGMWQVMTRSDGDLDQQQALDSYYIRNWSFWLDLYLLLKTLSAVSSGRGAY